MSLPQNIMSIHFCFTCHPFINWRSTHFHVILFLVIAHLLPSFTYLADSKRASFFMNGLINVPFYKTTEIWNGNQVFVLLVNTWRQRVLDIKCAAKGGTVLNLFSNYSKLVSSKLQLWWFNHIIPETVLNDSLYSQLVNFCLLSQTHFPRVLWTRSR